MQEGYSIPTDQLHPVLRRVANDTLDLVKGMVEDNCLVPFLVLANDLGETQVFLLPEFSAHTQTKVVTERVNQYAKDHRLVAICIAAEAWMCDEGHFREYMNLDEQAAVEHLVSNGTPEESAQIIASQVIQGMLIQMAHMYHSLYGDLAMFPASYEGVPFRIESIWGVYHMKSEILRGVDEMALEHDNLWRELAPAGGEGMYTNLLQLEPGC